MRLIDADDLEKRLHERALDEWNQRTATTWSNAFLECEDMVYDAPTVDAEPVRHGHWAHIGGDEWCCSKCGFVVVTEGSWEHPKERGYDYCYHCGAKMDEVEEDG